MNNRLAIQDIAGLLAEYTGKDKKEAERFLREFVRVVMEGVFADKMVKIKGLGVFKVISVEKRESIHVNTGERFLIPEHYKFSFIPDKELKDVVNKPFSFFETTELSENCDLSDVYQSEEDELDKEVEDESVEELLPGEKPVVEVPVVTPFRTETAEPPVGETNASQSDNRVKSPVENPPYFYHEVLREEVEYDSHSFLKRLIILIFTLGLVGIVGAYFYFDFKPFTGYSYEDSLGFSGIEKEITTGEQIDVDSLDMTTRDSDDTLSVEPTTETQPEPVEPAGVVPSKTNELAKIKIKTGDRLTLIALEYYGNKIFWVYLYEHNKEVIHDPNNVPVGTEIVIPAPEQYRIDVHSRSSIEKAAALQTQILSGNTK